MLKRLVVFGSIVAATAAGVPAQAVQYIYTLSGGYSASFAINKTTSPDSFTATTTTFDAVFGTYAGDTRTATVTFGSSDQGPDVSVAGVDGGPYVFFGPIIFVNSPSRPRFEEGTYALTSALGPTQLVIREAEGVPGSLGGGGGPGGGEGGGDGSTVPEPAIWALMIGGFAMTGFMQRRRWLRQQVQFIGC